MTDHLSMLALFGARTGSDSTTQVSRFCPPGPITPDPEPTTTLSSISVPNDTLKVFSIPTPRDYDSELDTSKGSSENSESHATASARAHGIDELAGDSNSLDPASRLIFDGPIKRHAKKAPVQLESNGSTDIIHFQDSSGTQPGRRKSTRILANLAKLPQQPRSPQKPKITRERKIPGKVALQGSILSESAFKRKVYLANNKSYFLPLLPKNNAINVLINDPRLEGHSVQPYTELAEQPAGIRATLKGYQLQGLSFLLHIYRNGMSGILGDEMGLGKTLQTLSLFQYLREEDKSAGTLHQRSTHRPFLVICPLSVLNSWVAEAARWTPELNVIRFHGPKEERKGLKQGVFGSICQCPKSGGTNDHSRCPPDIVITTYETLTTEHVWLKRTFNWRCIVLDEGHKVKNHQSQVSRCLMSLKAESRYILTGTPLQNNLLEMWSLLHWMFPDIFVSSTQAQFKNAFDLTRGSVDIGFMDCSKSLLELIMLRRMKESPGVSLGLPAKEEIVLYLPLTPIQQFWYRKLLTQSRDSLLEGIFKNSRSKEQASRTVLGDAEVSISNVLESDEWRETGQILQKTVETMATGKNTRQLLLNLLMQLRKCCGHPYLLPGAEPDPYRLGEHVIRASSKFIVLEKLLHEVCVVRKEKILIFSGFVTVLNYVEDMLDYLFHKGMPIRMLRLDGSTARARRNLNIRLFNNSDLPYNVMLISTKAGGLGITLTAATSVVFLDEEWNPQLTKQAEARAHRIGQTKKVTIYKMSTQGTVEEQMLGRIRKKLYLSAKITESLPSFYGAGTSAENSHHLDAGDDMVQLSSNELMSLIRRGAQALGHDEIDATELLSWDLNTVIEKCREKDVDPSVAGTDAPEDEEKWLQTMEKVETSLFQGARMSKPTTKGAKGRPKKSMGLNELGEPIGTDGQSAVVEIPPPLDRAARREGKNTTVLIDGYHVSKATLGCKDWEAVATISGPTPTAEPKRERRKFGWQKRCQACYKDAAGCDGDEHPPVQCTFCPRSYHFECLPAKFQKAYLKSISFSCPQHKCLSCKKATEQAGGMLFRCRWCPGAYCEDCLAFYEINLVGDYIDEMMAYGFYGVSQLFWIECGVCLNRMKQENQFDKMVKEWLQEGEKMRDEMEPVVQIDEEEEEVVKETKEAVVKTVERVEDAQPMEIVNLEVDDRPARAADNGLPNSEASPEGEEKKTELSPPPNHSLAPSPFSSKSAAASAVSSPWSPLKRRRGRPRTNQILTTNVMAAFPGVAHALRQEVGIVEEPNTYSDDDAAADDYVTSYHPDDPAAASTTASPTKRAKRNLEWSSRFS